MTDVLIIEGNVIDPANPAAALILGGGIVPTSGAGVITRVAAPAEEDMADPSAVLWLDLSGGDPVLKVTWLDGGSYGTADLLTLTGGA